MTKEQKLLLKESVTVNQLKTDFCPLGIVADRYHISISYLYKLHYAGTLSIYKLGTLSYVKISEFERLFHKQSNRKKKHGF